MDAKRGWYARPSSLPCKISAASLADAGSLSPGFSFAAATVAVAVVSSRLELGFPAYISGASSSLSSPVRVFFTASALASLAASASAAFLSYASASESIP